MLWHVVNVAALLVIPRSVTVNCRSPVGNPCGSFTIIYKALRPLKPPSSVRSGMRKPMANTRIYSQTVLRTLFSLKVLRGVASEAIRENGS